MMRFYYVEGDAYKALPLGDRLLVDMISEMSMAKFANKVVDIIVKQCGEKYNDIPADEMVRIREMQKNFEAGINAYCALRKVLKSIDEDTDYEQLDNSIRQVADKMADEELVKCGWVKERSEIIE